MKIKFNLQKTIVVFIVGIHIFILSSILFFPYPELLIYSYLTQKGLLAYKQIFDQHFPGLMFFPVNIYSIGIDTPEKLRLLSYLIVFLNHILIFKIVKKVSKSKKLPIITAFIYLLWQIYLEGYVLWIDSFISLSFLLGFYLFQKNTNKHMFFSGLILGISVLLKQVAIPLVLILIIYVFIKNKLNSKTKYFLFGLIIPLAYLLLWVIDNHIIDEFIYWTFIFNMTTFAHMGRKTASIFEIVKISPLFIPTLYLIYKRKELVLIIFSLCSLFFVLARFDFVHLQPFLVFVLISLSSIYKYIKKSYLYIYILILICAGIILNLKNINYYFPKRLLFYSSFERKLSESVQKYIKEDDKIFTLGTTPHIYYLTNTLPSGNLFVFQFPWFMIEAEDKIYKAMVGDKPKLIIRDQNASVSGMNLVEYAPVINKYINDYYLPVEMIDGVELLLPNGKDNI